MEWELFSKEKRKNEKAADEMKGSVDMLALSQNPETFSNPVILMRKWSHNTFTSFEMELPRVDVRIEDV